MYISYDIFLPYRFDELIGPSYAVILGSWLRSCSSSTLLSPPALVHPRSRRPSSPPPELARSRTTGWCELSSPASQSARGVSSVSLPRRRQLPRRRVSNSKEGSRLAVGKEGSRPVVACSILISLDSEDVLNLDFLGTLLAKTARVSLVKKTKNSVRRE